MFTRQKHKKPGPIAKSCRTCRARRKKCDGLRPVCERCNEGGFRCWGFELPDEIAQNFNSTTAPLIEASKDVHRSEFLNATTPSDTPPFELPHSTAAAQNPQLRNKRVTKPVASEPTEIFYPQSNITDDAKTHLADGRPYAQPLATAGPLRRQARSLVVANTISKVAAPVPRRLRPYSQRLSNQPSSSSQFLHVQTLGDTSYAPTLTKIITPLSVDDRDVIRFIVTRFENMICTSIFRPPYELVLRARGSLSQRAQFFPVDRYALLVGAKLFDCVLDGLQVHQKKFAQYHAMVKRFEQKLSLVPTQDLTAAETQSYFYAMLEVMVVKLKAISGKNAYVVLRKHAPIFLRAVSLDVASCSSSRSMLPISVAHVLASTRSELPHFVLLDAIYSMVYGLPNAIKYDTSVPPFKGNIHHIGAFYGCPAELQVIIIDLNRLLAQKQAETWPDWRHLEQRIWTWRPSSGILPDEESWKRVCRLAAHESWRHTLLIYLYLAICDFESDDPRVRSSVRQVFQTISVITQRQQPMKHIDFSVQYLFAGAFTSSEKYRTISRNQLFNSRNPGYWLIDGTTVVPVLDHLWHGAAANGRAVRWSDYMYSRQVALPVPI